MSLRDRLADAIAAFFVGSAPRSVAIGAALLYAGARWLGWWTLALVLVGAAWELLTYPGRLPWR